MKKEIHLVDKACEVFGLDLPDLAREIGIAKTTLQTWKDNGKCSALGEVALNALIENHELKKKDAAIKNLLDLYGVVTTK